MATNKKSTEILPPGLAVRLAWDLTGEWSETTAVQDRAKIANSRLAALADQALNGPDEDEKKYVPQAVKYIYSCQRSLAAIYASRKLNFEEVRQMREAQRESIEAYSKLTANWQSAWPRVVSVGIGGSAGALTLVDLAKGYFPSINPAVLQAYMFIIGAGVLYLVNEFIVLPWVRRSLMMERVRGDYDRNLYYAQFIERTRSALVSLYEDVDRVHQKVFRSPYEPQPDVTKIVDGVLAGVLPTMCDKVHDHMHRGLATPNLWSICETGTAKESCPNWTK